MSEEVAALQLLVGMTNMLQYHGCCSRYGQGFIVTEYGPCCLPCCCMLLRLSSCTYPSNLLAWPWLCLALLVSACIALACALHCLSQLA